MRQGLPRQGPLAQALGVMEDDHYTEASEPESAHEYSQTRRWMGSQGLRSPWGVVHSEPSLALISPTLAWLSAGAVLPAWWMTRGDTCKNGNLPFLHVELKESSSLVCFKEQAGELCRDDDSTTENGIWEGGLWEGGGGKKEDIKRFFTTSGQKKKKRVICFWWV